MRSLPRPTRVRYPLSTFFVFAYGISWLVWSPLWLPALGLERLPVLPGHHVFGAAGPIAAAFIVSAETGRKGPTDLLRRMGLLRGRIGWATLALMGPFVLLATATFSARVFDGQSAAIGGFGRSMPFPELSTVGAFAYNLMTFGYGEEVGWRGFALPRLQTRHSALGATVLLTLGWALWHWPLFLYRPGYTSMDAAGVAGWFLSLLTGGVVLTWLYNESRGSILVVALFHAAVDVIFTADSASQLEVNMTGALITVSGALVLVLAGPRFLSRKGKVIRTRDGRVTGFLLRDSRIVMC